MSITIGVFYWVLYLLMYSQCILLLENCMTGYFICLRIVSAFYYQKTVLLGILFAYVQLVHFITRKLYYWVFYLLMYSQCILLLENCITGYFICLCTVSAFYYERTVLLGILFPYVLLVHFITRKVFYRVLYFLIYTYCILLPEKCFIGYFICLCIVSVFYY